MKKAISAILALTVIFSSLAFGLTASGAKKSGLSDEWKETVLNNYNEFIAETDGDSDKIPMIVTTDQHGTITVDNEIYRYFDKIVDWSKISKILNLGDTVQNEFNIIELISYRIATSCMPRDKRIEVVGNHDRASLHYGKIVDFLFFPTPHAERSRERNAFVVKDEKFNIRYLAVDPKNYPWNYTCGTMTTSQADFIIKELSKDDPSDIVLISHPYLFRDEIIRRDGTTFTGSDYFIGSAEQYADVKQSFVDMLAARKNKTAGVFIDCAGVEHPYDFSNCEGDFLMTLHGHHHTEGYETSCGITEFMFQSMRYDNEENSEPDCTYFAYIDTKTKTFKCWKNLPGYEAWEIDIA